LYFVFFVVWRRFSFPFFFFPCSFCLTSMYTFLSLATFPRHSLFLPFHLPLPSLPQIILVASVARRPRSKQTCLTKSVSIQSSSSAVILRFLFFLPLFVFPFPPFVHRARIFKILILTLFRVRGRAFLHPLFLDLSSPFSFLM